MNSLEEVLEKAQTKLQKLILSIVYQYETVDITKLQDLTGESLLALLPTLHRLTDRNILTSPKPDVYTLA